MDPRSSWARANSRVAGESARMSTACLSSSSPSSLSASRPAARRAMPIPLGTPARRASSTSARTSCRASSRSWRSTSMARGERQGTAVGLNIAVARQSSPQRRKSAMASGTRPCATRTLARAWRKTAAAAAIVASGSSTMPSTVAAASARRPCSKNVVAKYELMKGRVNRMRCCSASSIAAPRSASAAASCPPRK